MTGMPRTHMAWLSVLLTTDKTVCYPEPLKDMQEPEDIDRLMGARGYTHVGVADTGLAFFPDVMTRLLCPVVLIDRDRNEVLHELLRMSANPETAKTYVDRMEKACERVARKANVLVINYKQLRDRRIAQKIFWHCLPGVAFDEVRYSLLSQLVIEQNPLGILSSVKNNLSGMQQMFSDRYEHLNEVLQ